MPKITSWGGWNRCLYDALSMAGVGFFRSAAVFLPFMLTSLYFSKLLPVHSIVESMLIIIIGQPIAYILGWLAPLSLPSLQKNSTEWCEFLTGVVWGVAVCVL